MPVDFNGCSDDGTGSRVSLFFVFLCVSVTLW